jgi:ABC-type nitrate/sulfonate/bicarbonate transport system permease component
MTNALPTVPHRVAARRVDRTTKPIMWGLRILSFATVFLVWEWYGRSPDSFTVAPLSEVLTAIVAGFADGTLTTAVAGTLVTFGLGFAIAAVLGVSLGLWIGVSRYARNAIEPLVHAAYATPVSLLIPILGIYAGLGLSGRVTLVVLWSVFEILINTSSGVREVSPALIEVGRSFNASKKDLYLKVVLPAAKPYVALGLRIGVARALRGAVTAELLLSAANLGKVLLVSGSTFRVADLLAATVITIVLGVVLMRIATAIEARSLRYQAG